MSFLSKFFSRASTPTVDDVQSAGTTVPRNQPPIDWRTSEGHQRLLLNFFVPNSVDSVPTSLDWKTLLHEPLASAIERFRSEDALTPVNDPKWRILHGRGADELKAMCKDRGLGTVALP